MPNITTDHAITYTNRLNIFPAEILQKKCLIIPKNFLNISKNPLNISKYPVFLC